MDARWIIGRLGALLITLFVGSIAIYSATFLAPGDPATLLVGGPRPSPEALAAARAEFNLDQPIWSSYLHWLGDVLHGDLGTSIANRAPVNDIIGGRIGMTAMLVAYAAVLVIVGGLVLGAAAGWLGGRVATTTTVTTTILMSAPTFAVAVILITVFAANLGWFPVYGNGEGLADRLWHLTLPAVSLACSWLAYVATITHESIRTEATSEHVEAARSRGLAERQILRRHVLRNASGPILAASGIAVAGMFASTAVAERAFGVDGIGSLLVVSAARQDLVTVQAIGVILIATFVVINTLVDVLSALLDPRMRQGVRT